MRCIGIYVAKAKLIFASSLDACPVGPRQLGSLNHDVGSCARKFFKCQYLWNCRRVYTKCLELWQIKTDIFFRTLTADRKWTKAMRAALSLGGHGVQFTMVVGAGVSGIVPRRCCCSSRLSGNNDVTLINELYTHTSRDSDALMKIYADSNLCLSVTRTLSTVSNDRPLTVNYVKHEICRLTKAIVTTKAFCSEQKAGLEHHRRVWCDHRSLIIDYSQTYRNILVCIFIVMCKMMY